MSKRELPQGWTSAALGEVLPLSYGKALAERLRDATGQVSVFGSSGIVGMHGAALVDSPSIIVGRKGSAGAVHLASGPSWPIDTAYYCIPPKGIDLRWAYYRLLSLNLAHLDQSTAIPSLSRDDYSRIVVALPPSAEQERIVAAIDALFTRLDAAQAEIVRVDHLRGQYRRSVFRAAIAGALVDSARANWRTESVENLFEVHTGATPLRSEARYYSGGTIPWLTSACVNVDPVSEADQFVTESAINETNCRLLPAGSLLIAMYGEGYTRGKITSLAIDAATNQACAVLVPRTPDQTLCGFVKLSFWDRYEALRRLSSGGVQPNLNLGIIKRLRLDVPPRGEMQKIVDRAAELLSDAATLEEHSHLASRSAEGLRQAILAAAVRGELVSQDPSDEPAEKLLERIRSRRAVDASAKRVFRKPKKAAA